MWPAPLQAVARFRPAPGRLELPDVCCDVTYVRGRAMLCGPLTRARPMPHVGEDVLLLKIRPTAARALLGVPLSELTDAVVPLDQVSSRLARELDARYESGRLLELVAAPSAGALDGERRFAAGAGALACGRPVAVAAEAVALSERQLERLFREHAGLAPKTFARIVRFRGAVVAARRGAALATAAAAHRYADQAHFSRDVRELTGSAPRALLPNVGSLQDLLVGEI